VLGSSNFRSVQFPTAFTALVARVRSVQSDVDKLASENSTLQTYIDNLTMELAKRK